MLPAPDAHQKELGCIPRLMAGDAAFFSAENETAAHERGLKDRLLRVSRLAERYLCGPELGPKPGFDGL